MAPASREPLDHDKIQVLDIDIRAVRMVKISEAKGGRRQYFSLEEMPMRVGLLGPLYCLNVF